MKKLLNTLCLLGLLVLCINAQNSKIPSVFKFSPSHVYAIKTGNEVKGYFAYYLLDKKDSKNDNYVMQLYDENLNEVGQKKITMLKTQYLDEVGFDGNVIIAKFVDEKAKAFVYVAYNEKAEEVGRKEVPTSKLELEMFMYNAQKNVESAPTFMSAEGAGFVNYSMETYKKYGFKIDFLSDADIKKGWQYTSDKNSDKVMTASYLTSSDNLLLSLISHRDKMMSAADFGYNVLALDLKTGKKISDVKCENAQYSYTPMGAYIEDNKYVIVGQFVKKGDNLLKASSIGLAVLEYDLTGKLLSEKYSLWKDCIGKFAEMKGNKLLDGGYVFFHKIVKSPDGNIVLVGEQFHREANAAGIVMGVLGGGGGGAFTKLVIGDFLLLTLDKSYNLVALKRIEKGKSDFVMNGLDYLGANVAAILANARGSFDYDYTTFNDDKSNFSVVYSDYDKLEGSKKSEAYVGNISYNGGKYSIDKVPYKRGVDATLYRVYPAKNGYFMLLTYFRKTKQLNFDLVKFNN